MQTVVSLGEALIDFVAVERGHLSDVTTFTKNAGGAPANVAACVAKLGGHSAFVGGRSDDAFGRFLLKTLADLDVGVEHFYPIPSRQTAMAFVALDESGDRSFQFLRQDSADEGLTPEHIPDELLRSARVLHVGSLSMTTEPSRSATMHAIEQMKQAGGSVSFDPNWRPSLWPNLEEARSLIDWALARTDILKVNREEFGLFAGSMDLAHGARALHNMGPRTVLVTLDEQGCFYSHRKDEGVAGSASSMDVEQGYVPGRSVQVVDTTGAGDTFVGAYLSRFAKSPEGKSATESDVREWVKFAVAASSLATTKSGAINALPTLQEVRDALKQGW